MFRWISVVVVLAVVSPAWTQEQTSQPVMSNPKLVSIGEEHITQSMMDARLASLPAELPAETRRAIQKRFIQEVIFEHLLKEYLRANNVSYTEKDMFEVKAMEEQFAQRNPSAPRTQMKREDRENLARSIHLQKETASQDKIDALIKEHPEYFNGTRICASHILIRCSPLASSKVQKKAMHRIKRLQTDLRAGQISFADAARAYSSCPSKDKGGDLGEFSFGDMVPTFSRAAFNTKVGDVSDIVRTEHGFHLIQVTGRSEGIGKPGPQARQQAKQLLLAELQNRIFDQALTTVSVIKYKSAAAATQPAKSVPENTPAK